MQNTNSRQCSEQPPRTREIELFGKRITCKNCNCSRDGGPYTQKPEQIKLQLSICPTAYCPGKCPFCIAYPGINSRDRLDLKKLENALRQLGERKIVRGVSITGGEPFYDVPLLNRVVNLVFDVLGEHTELSLNTNGMAIERMHELDRLSYIDAIHISRHHYDEKTNSLLFGIPMPSNEELKRALHSVSFRDIFVFNCMLMKDYIGSADEAHRYMDFAIEMGAAKVSFITGTPVNDFVRRQAVSYDDVLRGDDPQLLFTRSYRDYEFCSCHDGVYVSPRGEIIEFYGRCTGLKSFPYVRGFVYDADDHLRTGFGGEVLL